MEDTKREALSYLAGYRSVMLATVDAKRLDVRPVSLIKYDNAYWIEAGTASAKTAQIRDNPNIEQCLIFTEGANSGYVRLSGRTEIVTSAVTRKRISSHTGFFNNYWSGPEDPSFTLLHIIPAALDYMRPGEIEPHMFDF